MKELLISRGEVVDPQKTGLKDLHIENGQVFFDDLGASAGTQKRLKTPENYQSQQVVNAENCYVTAGLFDLQVNGCSDCNLWADPTASQFSKLCNLLLKAGVTAFLPTLITDDLKHLQKNIAFLESMGATGSLEPKLPKADNKPDPASLITMPGIHLEGPFLSPDKPGVHPKQHIRHLLMPELKELARPSIKLITLAPELNNAEQAIKYLRQKAIVVSLGHSNATFNEAEAAFNSGVTMVTHTFNALPPIHQRHPGAVVAALLTRDVYCCIICDGLHVDPQMVKLLVETKGIDKVILVTDIASVGTTGGDLVGASITLSEAVRNIVNWGIVTFPEAIKMATFNPAKATHLDQNLGQIRNGGRANLVIWDKKTLAIKHVIANGCLVFSV